MIARIPAGCIPMPTPTKTAFDWSTAVDETSANTWAVGIPEAEPRASGRITKKRSAAISAFAA